MPGDGLNQPSTEGTGYDMQDLPDGEAVRVMPADLESGSYLVMAHPQNEGILYIGWDNEVDDTNGTPLESGVGLSIDVDNQSQNLWVYSPGTGNRISFIATN